MKVVIGSIGRYGDTILTSIVVNMVAAKGHSVLWATSAPYAELARTTAPNAEIVIHQDFPDCEYTDEISTSGLIRAFPGHDAHINAQFGAREGYSHLSGKHPLHWLRDKVIKVGIEIGTDWKNHLIFKYGKKIDFKRPEGRLAVIAPGVISAPSVIDDRKLAEIHSELTADYDHVRLLTPTKPDGNYEAIYGYTFVEAVGIIQMADHYVGQDSGLSWGALYSRCTKEVYRRRERLDAYKFSFEEVDLTIVEKFV